MTRRLRAQWLHHAAALLLVPAAVFAVVWSLHVSGRLFRLQVLAYDLMIRLNASPDPDATPVVIVGIDEPDIRELNQYPISDRQMLTLLERLEAAGARTIGIDIYRDLPTPTRDRLSETESDYAKLNAYLVEHPNIVVVHRVAGFAGDPDYVLPPKSIAENDAGQQAGASSLAFDDDGVVRRGMPFWPDPRTGDNAVSLGSLLAMKYLGVEDIGLRPADDDESRLLLGKAVLTRPKLPAGFYTRSHVSASEAEGQSFQWMIDFRGPETPRQYHLRDVFGSDAVMEKLRDKLVIIGISAKSIKDEVASPFSPRTYGFVMHGYVADQIIRWAKTGERPATFASNGVSVLWTVAWAVLGGLAGGLGIARSLTKVLLLLIAELLALTALVLWALKFGLILPFVAPLLAAAASVLLALAYMSAVERKDRQLVRQLMDMHISRQVAEQLLENRESFFSGSKLAPQRTTATVLFSDLMDFTPIAERLDSMALMNWLNDFFEQMTKAVEDCGGVVNKFNGDMVMALFGPPQFRDKDEDVADDARAAVRCAVMMRKALAEMNHRWKAEGLPTPLMRIGIYTGPLVAGSLGGKNRVEYTVIGDTVNTASRLESSNKHCMDEAIDGTRIIVGDTTCAAITGHYHVKAMGEWELKGKVPLRVHAVLGEHTAIAQSAADPKTPAGSRKLKRLMSGSTGKD